MRQLVNITVSPGPGHLLADWQQAGRWLERQGLDGFEVYPCGDWPATAVPDALVGGLHLSFLPNLRPFWYQDRTELLRRFDSYENVEGYFGCRTPEQLVARYRHQLDLAEDLGAPYVVFHPVDCDMDALFTQAFPWHWRDTLDLMAELLNEALKGSRFTGKLLFENLWWPGSFRLDSRDEYDYLRRNVNYDNCGLCFDTGHMMATNNSLVTEQQGVEYLMRRVQHLDLAAEIHTVHLNCSLNGAYQQASYQVRDPYRDCDGFWQRLDVALKHVSAIDAHRPFAQVDLRPLLDRLAPQCLVHELAQDTLAQWQFDVATQQRSVADPLLSKTATAA